MSQRLHHVLATQLKQAARFQPRERRLVMACNRFRVGEATDTDLVIMIDGAKRILGLEVEL